MITFVVVFPLVLTTLMIQSADSELYLSSLFSNPRDPYVVIFFVPFYYVFFMGTSVGYLTIFIFFIPFVYSSIALLKEMR